MGGFNPSPEKFGGEAGHIEEVLLESLLEGDGSALAKDVDSYVWAERLAESRCVAYLWHLNARMGHQWDPDRVTDFLPRWERILGLRPLAGATDVERRAAMRAKLELAGQPGTQQVVHDLLASLLGPIFVGLVNSSSSVAVGYVPGGVTVAGGVTLPDGDWYSTIAYLAIQVVQSAGVDDPTFYGAVAGIAAFLDDLLPVWVTWAWFRDGGGGAGFFLDDEHNLDNERFD